MKEIIYRVLEAMSYRRGEAESRITDLGRQLLKHIIKLRLYPESHYAKGWTKEIRAWYIDISDIATGLKKGKQFKASQVKGFLFSDRMTVHKLEQLVDSIVELNDELDVPEYDIDTLYKVLDHVYEELADCAVNETPWSQFVDKLRN